MVQRVILVTIWALALSVVLGVGYLIYDIQVRRSVPPTRGANLPGVRQQPVPWARWTVTESLSAHHVLIAHIETRYLDEALSIAKQVADPVKFRYAEIVLYFHRPGRPDLLPPRKIVWTPDRDYEVTNYEEE